MHQALPYGSKHPSVAFLSLPGTRAPHFLLSDQPKSISRLSHAACRQRRLFPGSKSQLHLHPRISTKPWGKAPRMKRHGSRNPQVCTGCCTARRPWTTDSKHEWEPRTRKLALGPPDYSWLFCGASVLTGVNFQRCWSQGAQRLSEAGKPLRYRWPARLLIPDEGGPTLRHSRWVRWASGRKC